MAYAENTEGRAYGLEERINITPRALEQDDWTGARALENRRAGGTVLVWYLLPLGGIRLVVPLRTWVDVSSARDTQGLWLWKENLNWLWTDRKCILPLFF